MADCRRRTSVDILVAVRDEEESIPIFLGRIEALKLPKDVELKVVFIEDSSTDGTRPLLKRLASEKSVVGYYSLAQGFGQGPAVIFGLSRSAADAAVMMDVDGSHPLEVIPEMIRRFLDGAQVVQCVRKTLANRKLYRRIGAAVFQFVARLLTGIDTNEQNIFYRLVSADIARQLLKQPRYWHWLRFRLPRRLEGTLSIIHVDTDERVFGESKYGSWRLMTLAIDGILSLITKPRFTTLLASMGLIAALLVRAGLWPLAAVVAGGIVWLISRYIGLQRSDVLQRMQVLECGNVPGVT